MVDLLEFLKKDKKAKIDKSVSNLLKEEEKFGLKKYKTYQEFGEKIYKIKNNVKKNIEKLRNNNKRLIGYGSPAKSHNCT